MEPKTNAYDALAPYYREYAAGRSEYLSAVDRFIIEHAPRPVESILDVGAGDGVRGMALAQELGARRVVLCEPSHEMARYCRKLGPDEVWEVRAEQLPQIGAGFDVILCLWNVLGHIPSRKARLAALAAMRRLLRSGGVLFLDVNNRYNASAYGWFRVNARRLVDFLVPDERRGDATFSWEISRRTFPAKGHLFTPSEIEGLMGAGDLLVTSRTVVNYRTGEYSMSPYGGQLLYRATSVNRN